MFHGNFNMDNMSPDQDVLQGILALKIDVKEGHCLLKEIRSNEEDFVINCHKKQEIQAVYAVHHLHLGQSYNTQILADCGIRVEETRTEAVDALLQQNMRTFANLFQRFEQVIARNTQSLTFVQNLLISKKLVVWKHEQQRHAAGIRKASSVSLDQLQLWFEELAQLTWESYEQLQEAERILGNCNMQTGTAASLAFVQFRNEEVVRLLEVLLNNSLIVEQQPPQIVKMKTKFPRPVIVSLLIGKRLNIHINGPELSARIISEGQARELHRLQIPHKIETIGEIMNSRVGMDRSKADSKRVTFIFKNMQLKTIKRTDRRTSPVVSERVMEEKSCLYFECMVNLGSLKFKVTTISFPLVVTSHGSQEALAVASISWDNAFAEIGRIPFHIPDVAKWEDVAQILNWKFVEITGRELTKGNLDCLARKAFKNRFPQPEVIKWSELCKEHLPGQTFSFWSWFHAAVKLIEKKEVDLRDLWKADIIEGFIERETAENLVSSCGVGTFLLRFPDSILGSISIVLCKEPGTAICLNPFQPVHLQAKRLADTVREIVELKFLYQHTELVPKAEVFRQYYSSQSCKTSKGYWPLGLSILSQDSDDIKSSRRTGSTSSSESQDSESVSVKNYIRQKVSNAFSFRGLSRRSGTSPQDDPSKPRNSLMVPGNPTNSPHNLNTPSPPVNFPNENVFHFSTEFETIYKVLRGNGDVEMGESY